MSDPLAGELGAGALRLEAQLGEAVLLVERVGDAVLRPEPAEAVRLRQDGARLKRGCRRIEVDLVSVAARTAPRGDDLRHVVALLQIAQHAALIANQFGLIAEQLQAVDASIHDRRGTAQKVSRMAFMAAAQLAGAVAALARRERARAPELDREDDQLDQLNRGVFTAAHALEVSPRRRELALRHVLIARSLERVGDNSVKIAEQAALLAGAPIEAGF